jgi:DNA-binding NarL/FixJ family response regulator
VLQDSWAPWLVRCRTSAWGQTLETSSVRILVAEGFKPFRSVIVPFLTENPSLRVVCEVKDGLEAVEKAQQLKPDLILMDIGLPILNGLEAARRIREILPSAKIVFLTQDSNATVMEEAFSLGASGYVIKSRTASDLLRAIGAVLQGKRFVSVGLGQEESK